MKTGLGTLVICLSVFLLGSCAHQGPLPEMSPEKAAYVRQVRTTLSTWSAHTAEVLIKRDFYPDDSKKYDVLNDIFEDLYDKEGDARDLLAEVSQSPSQDWQNTKPKFDALFAKMDKTYQPSLQY